MKPAAVLPLATLAVAVFAHGACRGGPQADANAPVAIGVGAVPGSPHYDRVVEGVELAVARLHGAAGSSPGSIRFRVRLPDRAASSAARVAEQLRNDRTVLAVVGQADGGNPFETLPIYADVAGAGANGVAVVSPTGSSPRLSGISPWFFRLAPSDAEAAGYTARWVLDSLRARRAAIVYRNDADGRDWAITFANSFVKGGGTVVTRDPYLSEVVEWDAYAALLAAQRPDVVLFPGDGDDAAALLRALDARGVRIPLVGGDGTTSMMDRPEAAGTRYVSFFDATRATGPEAARFVSAYRAKHHRDPDMYAALAYDAALMIGRSVIDGARSRAALRLALERIGAGTPAVDGATGRLAFERNHDIAGGSVIVARVPGDPRRTDGAR